MEVFEAEKEQKQVNAEERRINEEEARRLANPRLKLMKTEIRLAQAETSHMNAQTGQSIAGTPKMSVASTVVQGDANVAITVTKPKLFRDYTLPTPSNSEETLTSQMSLPESNKIQIPVSGWRPSQYKSEKKNRKKTKKSKKTIKHVTGEGVVRKVRSKIINGKDTQIVQIKWAKSTEWVRTKTAVTKGDRVEIKSVKGQTKGKFLKVSLRVLRTVSTSSSERSNSWDRKDSWLASSTKMLKYSPTNIPKRA